MAQQSISLISATERRSHIPLFLKIGSFSAPLDLSVRCAVRLILWYQLVLMWELTIESCLGLSLFFPLCHRFWPHLVISGTANFQSMGGFCQISSYSNWDCCKICPQNELLVVL